MSESQPRHAAPNPKASIKALRTVRFWAFPILATLALMSALAALYLGGILNPITNLRHFPIAVVNEDAGPWGAKLVEGLVGQADKNTFDIRVLTHDEAKRQLDNAKVYGELLIPPTFSSNLGDFGASAVTPTHADRPSVTIFTNQRAGTLGSSIAGQTLTKAMTIANGQVGNELSAQVAEQTGGAPLTVERRRRCWPIPLTLSRSSTTRCRTAPATDCRRSTTRSCSCWRALPAASWSARWWIRCSAMYRPNGARCIDSPSRSGSRACRRWWSSGPSWSMLGLLTSAIYLAIAHGLGMPIPLGWQLWLYGVFAISAVGITSSSLIAVLGSMGLLFSMLVFVILGLPSAGATVPLEAVPPFFRWLAEFEPMHQVFLGVRSLLYLNGHADAGLSQALWMTAIGLVIGLLVGGIITHIYDRKGFHRIQGAMELAIAAEHQAQHQARRPRSKPAPSTIEAEPRNREPESPSEQT